jgi:phage terminase small subunit
MMRIASEFCFMPASRGRIATAVQEPTNLLDLMEPAADDDEPSV